MYVQCLCYAMLCSHYTLTHPHLSTFIQIRIIAYTSSTVIAYSIKMTCLHNQKIHKLSHLLFQHPMHTETSPKCLLIPFSFRNNGYILLYFTYTCISSIQRSLYTHTVLLHNSIHLCIYELDRRRRRVST